MDSQLTVETTKQPDGVLWRLRLGQSSFCPRVRCDSVSSGHAGTLALTLCSMDGISRAACLSRKRKLITIVSQPGIVWDPIRHELTRTSSGNIRPQPSQLAEPLWTDSGPKSGISVHELISTTKKTKKTKRRRGMNGRIFSQNHRKREQSHQLVR